MVGNEPVVETQVMGGNASKANHRRCGGAIQDVDVFYIGFVSAVWECAGARQRYKSDTNGRNQLKQNGSPSRLRNGCAAEWLSRPTTCVCSRSVFAKIRSCRPGSASCGCKGELTMK